MSKKTVFILLGVCFLGWLALNIRADTRTRAVDTIMGAGIGGTAGAQIGQYMDRQAFELVRDLKSATVERLGEGIDVTFNSDLLFDKDSTFVSNSAKEYLDELAKTLNKYEDTMIVIQDHADLTGEINSKQQLSQERAKAVADYLEIQGVKATRISSTGQEVNVNVVEELVLRRVEVAIVADERLKNEAASGALQTPS